MRRRRIPKPRPKPAPAPEPVVEAAEPVDPRRAKRYHVHNAMRDNGDMPHDMEGDGFLEYLILNGMTEDIYWLNVSAGEDQALDIEKNGIPLRTDQLTNDQKGWAKADHYDHFIKETARWRPIPGKDSKVKPFKFAPRLRDRDYRAACDDGTDANLILWGYRWDMRELLQCQICGEVIVKTPLINRPDNDEPEEENDATHGHETLDAEPGQAA